MKRILLILAVLFSGMACKKNSTPAGKTYYTISGTLYLPDYYGGTGTKAPLANKLVYIGTNITDLHDTTDHSNSTLTDSKGNFTFYVDDDKASYHVWSFAADTSSSTFAPWYSAFAKMSVPGTDLDLTVEETTRNGIYIVTIDKYKLPLSRATVLYYPSKAAAEADIKYTGAGSSIKVTTDSLGKAFLGQVSPRQYYVNALLTVSLDSLHVFDATLTVPDKGIVQDTLMLQ